jgi:hypothetical protein
MEGADDLIRTLRTLQARADSKKTSAQFSWDAISRMMQNISGQEMDYDLFKLEFDANPALKKLVDRFDGKGIVIKTKEKSQPTEFGKKPKTNNSDALRAANKVIQQPG